jgi:hypothetical protein
MKKTVLIAVFCAAVLSPAKAFLDDYNEYWSWSYWYCPVSWNDARVYFQLGEQKSDRAITGKCTIYVAGEGALPNSDEGNTIKFPFSYLYGGPYLWVLPWRKGGDLTNIVLKTTIHGFLGFLGKRDDIERVYIEEGISSIGNWWFAGLGGLTKITVPLSLLYVGEGAFRGCGRLHIFECPDNVRTIGCRAFESCGMLSEFIRYEYDSEDDTHSKISKIPINIEDRAFADCGKLKYFYIPPNSILGDEVFSGSGFETVTITDDINYGTYIYKNCNNLKSVAFSGRVNKIPGGTFCGCINLPSIDIPNSVTNLGVEAFAMSKLTSVTVPGSVKDIKVSAFARCGNLTSVKICEGVKTINYWAFQSCPKLETVSLPEGLEYIDYYAFGWCDSLKAIECNATTPPAMHSRVFYASNITNTSLYVPRGSIDAYRNADVWKNFKHIGTYPEGMHIINGKNFTVNCGGKVKLIAKLLPHDAVPTIIWTSSNESIVSVVDGRVTAHAVGEAVITATTVNGIFKDECRITVKK